jgi:hypothetical protein
MTGKTDRFIKLAAIIGITGCVGDIVMTIIMGMYYPGYIQITDTMSKLGASDSPVGKIMSAWWMLLCVLFVVFAVGFKKRFSDPFQLKLAFWLIAIYALGEGMGSGIFPANYTSEGFTVSLIIHDTLGGIGIAGIMILPFYLKSRYPFSEIAYFKGFSLLVACLGIVWLVLFSWSKLYDTPPIKFLVYKGLWQRLLTLNYYVYIVVLAIIMLKGNSVIEKRQ